MEKGKSLLASIFISINGFFLGLKRKVSKSPVVETYSGYCVKDFPSEEKMKEILNEEPRYRKLGLANDHKPKMKR